MADSRRKRILDAFKARIEVIRVEDGFETDLGLNVLMWELPAFGPDDPKQVVAIIPREDQVSAALNNIPIDLPVDVAVLVAPDVTNPGALIEAGLADVKKAVELEDRTLGGLLRGGRNNPGGIVRGTTEPYPRVGGSQVTGASITYVLPYVEAYGYPDA
jgi:hypothetical protein